MPQTYLYKAAGDKGKRGIFLVPSEGSRSPPVATLPNGQTITGRYINTNEGRHQFSFGNDLFGVKDVKITYNGQTTTLPDPTLSYEGSSLENWKYRAKGDLKGAGAGGGSGGIPGSGGVGGGGYSLTPGAGGVYGVGQNVGSNYGGGYDAQGNPVPVFTDPSGLGVGQVSPSTVGFNPISVPPLSIPPYIPIDPMAFGQVYAQYNRDELQKNYVNAQGEALGLINTETQGLNQFAPQSEVLQQSLAGNENRFNQGQIANANTFNPSQVSSANAFNRGTFESNLDASGIPIRATIQKGLADSSRLAQGFLPTTLEDRAFEIAARTAAADNFQAKGLGTSAFTQNAIDKFTIQERLGLMQTGIAQQDQFLARGAQLLLDSPIKYNPLLNQPNTARVSQDIRGVPTLSGSQLATAQQGRADNYTLSTVPQAMQSASQQAQFKSQLDYNLGTFNTNLNLDQQKFNTTTGVGVQEFNTTTGLGAQEFNVGNNLKVDLTKLQATANNANLAYNYTREAAARAQQAYLAGLALSARGAGVTSGLGFVNPQAVPTAPTAPGQQVSSSLY